MIWKFRRKTKVFYVADTADWVIDEIGRSLKKYLKDYNFINTSDFSKATDKDIIQFSNRYQIDLIDENIKTDKIIITYYHGENTDYEVIEKFRSKIHLIKYIVTSNQITKKHLLDNGIPEEKIVIIPIGIEVSNFKAVDSETKKSLRTKYGIPGDHFVIGSFVKDGHGWGDGMEPKLIKGPDIFCDVVENLNEYFKRKVFVVLTGPARGYVKKRLDDMGVKYMHNYLDDYSKIGEFYNLLDLYIIPARLEGGPRAVMEAAASGIPIVSTNVGMVSEVLEHGKSGYITEVENVSDLTKYSKKILEDKILAKKISEEAKAGIERYDYEFIAGEFERLVYKALI